MPKTQKTNRSLSVALRTLGMLRFVLLFVALTGVFLYTRVSEPTRVSAAVPTTLNFQARLLSQSGAIVPDGTYNVEFKLYNVDTAGSALWTETRLTTDAANLRVTVKSGYLSVYLGDKTAFGAINWDQQLWLTMNIGGTAGTPTWDGEMNPRLRLTAVPYAQQAARANQLATASGANSGTLQFGALTSNPVITLPDATGTVCLQGSTACSFAPTTGGSGYIQNGTSIQSNANFAIQSASAASIGGVIRGAASQTANIFEIQDSAAAPLFRVAPGGGVWVTSVNNQFRAQDSTGVNNVYLSATATIGYLNTTSALPIAIATNNVERLRVDAVGNVGIGTTAPTGLLQVTQATAGTGTVATNGTTTLTGTNTQFLNTFKVGDTITVSGETVRTITAIASNTSLTVSVAFTTTASGLSYTLSGGDRLTVLGNGNIGIGTASPTDKLHLDGNGVNSFKVVLDNANQTRLSLNTIFAGSKQFSIANEGNANRLRFLISDAADANPVYGMVLQGNGNLGVNTGSALNSVSAQFQVQGGTTSSGATTMTASNGATTFTTSVSMTLNAGDYIIPTTTTAQARAVTATATGTSFTVSPAFSAAVTGETFTIYRAITNLTNNAGTSALFVQGSTGRVGIGTTITNRELTFGATDSGIVTDTTDGSDSKRLQLAGGGATSVTRGAYINLFGNEYSGNAGNLGLQAGNSAVSGQGAILLSTAGLERMRVDNTGNVGIGTIAPTGLLQVAQVTTGTGTVATNGSTTLTGTNTQFLNTFKVGDTITVSGETVRTITAIASNTSLTVSVAFTTTASGLSYTLSGGDRLTVLGNGNVGIGTVAPTTKLQVEDGDVLVQRSAGSTTQVQIGQSGVATWSLQNLATSGDFNVAHSNLGSVLRILGSNGNIGIGTIAPTASLHVVGSAPAAAGAGSGAAGTNGLTVVGGAGQGTTGNTGQAGGIGGVLSMTAGAGGTAPAGSTNGNGGSITLQGGAPGAGLGAAGSYGNIILNSSGGNVGIGTANPSGKLHVLSENNENSQLFVENTFATQTGTLLWLKGNNTTSDDNYNAIISRNTANNTTFNVLGSGKVGIGSTASTANILTVGISQLVVQNGGNVGIGIAVPTSVLHTVATGAKTANYTGNLLTNTATSSTASINKYGLEIQSTGTWNGTSANNVGLYVSSVTGGTNNYSAIFQGGNVGIGTAAPAATLHLAADAQNQLILDRLSATTAKSQISFRKQGTPRFSLGIDAGSADDNNFFIYDEVAAANRLYIASDGDVGIGTVDPQRPLDVVGTIRSSRPSNNTAFELYSTTNNASEWLMYLSNQDMRFYDRTGDRLTLQQGGNVGIGTTGPGNLLTVNQAGNATAATSTTYGFALNNAGSTNLTLGSDASYAYLQSWSGKPLSINSQGNHTYINPGTSSVFVGSTTSTSNYKLDLTGTLGITSGSYDANAIPGGNGLDLNGAVLRLGDPITGQTFTNGIGIKLHDQGTAHASIKYLPASQRIDFCNSGNSGTSLACNASAETLSLDLANQRVGIGITAPTSVLHTVATGAKTASYTGNLLTNTATSSTASVNKYGLEIQSTGTWNGTSANNVGLYVSSVTGGTNNYDAIFNGGGNVGIGTASPANKLEVVDSGFDVARFTSTSGTSGIVLTNNGAGSSARIRVFDNAGVNDLQFLTGGSERVRIASGGNVGIGDTTPAALLTVGDGDLFQVSGNDFRLLENGATPSLYGIFDVADLTGSSQTYTFNQGGVVCTDSGNCNGAGATLQTGYANSISDANTPEIRLDNTKTNGSLDIQDANTTLGATANLLTVRASNAGTLGSLLFGVQGNGDVTNSGNGIIQGSSLTIGTSNATTGSIVLKNSGNTNVLTLLSGTTGSNLTLTLPTADGGSSDCLKTNGAGVLAFAACIGGGSGGVNSVNTLQGSLTLAGTTNQINVANGGTTITLSTPQDINNTSSPKFASLTTGSAPTTLTTITDNPLTSGAVTINVASTTSYPSGSANAPGTLLIESEIVTYTGVTATSFTGVVRGAYGSTAASHASGVTVNNYLFTVATGTTTSPKLVVAGNGNVGIGDASPAALLTVGNGDLFQVQSNGRVGLTEQIDIVGTYALIQSATAGNDLLIRTAAGTGDIIFQPNNTEAMRITDTGNVGIGGVTNPSSVLHTVATGAKTANYTGNLLTNTATSSTASVNKYGLEIQSTGTWNGTSANNVGLYVSSVTGGTNNYDAIFNGGGNVGIGTAAPTAKLNIANAAAANTSTGLLLQSTFAPTAGGTQTNANLVVTNAPTTSANTAVGLSLAVNDSTALTNTLQGINLTLSDTGTTAKTVRGLFIDTSGTTNASAVVTAALFRGTSTTNLLIQNSGGGTELLRADTTNMVLKIGTTGAPTFGATTRLFTTVAEVSTTLRIGDATNGQEFSGTSAPVFRGTGRPSRSVTLSPEYAGAVMTGDGTGGNVGSMTSDFCSGSSLRNIPAASNPCAASEEKNYYSWTGQATNDYDIFVRYQVPSDFSSFAATNPIQFSGWRSSSSAGTSVTLTVYNQSGTVCGTATSIANTTSWTNTNYTSAGCTPTAGQVLTFRISLSVGVNNEIARAGDITINYLSGF